MSTFVLSLVFALGVGAIAFAAIPSKGRPTVQSPKVQSSVKRFQEALHKAGIFDQAPSLVVIILGTLSGIVGVIAAIIFGSPFAIFIGPPVVGAMTFWVLHRRQRQFMQRATNELVPFLNKIASSVKAGKPAQQAYLDAVAEAGILGDVLGNSAAKIAAGEKFSDSLLATLEVLPLRMWAVFVRQLELYEQMGGDVGSVLESTVNQVNQMLQLQAEARADFAIQARQQQLIIGILVIGFVAFAGTQPDAAKQTIEAFLHLNFIAIAMALVGSILVFGGLWFLGKQIRDVEEKIAF